MIYRTIKKIIEKRQKTNIKLHDDPSWNNMPKNQQTCIEKYGVDNIRKSNSYKSYVRKVKLEKYGNEKYINIEKIKASNQAHFGVDWPMQNEVIRSKAASKYQFNEKLFDSEAELCYYIWLKDNNILFEYQPMIKFEYKYNDKTHFYFPDFIVEGQIVEIKGDHFFKEDGTMQNPFDHSLDMLYEAKHQCMLKNNVKIIRANEYNKYIEYVKNKYGNDFIKSLKQK